MNVLEPGKTSSVQNGVLLRLQAVFSADPKKTAVLLVLVGLLAVMAGRLVLRNGNGQPARAGAAMTQGAAASTGGMGGAGASAPSNPPAFGRPDLARGAAVSAAIRKWTDAPVPPLSRNLFDVRIEYFPVDGSRTLQSTGGDEGFWSRLEKSLALQADERDKRENLIANYRAEAAKLRLESTMLGPQPVAMVNGEFVGEGSVVASFRVLKIEARRIIVEREGIRLEIQMR